MSWTFSNWLVPLLYISTVEIRIFRYDRDVEFSRLHSLSAWCISSYISVLMIKCCYCEVFILLYDKIIKADVILCFIDEFESGLVLATTVEYIGSLSYIYVVIFA